MWEESDDKGSSIVHVLNVVKGEAVDGPMCKHVCLGLRGGIQCPTTLHDHHLNIIRCIKSYNITFYS